MAEKLTLVLSHLLHAVQRQRRIVEVAGLAEGLLQAAADVEPLAVGEQLVRRDGQCARLRPVGRVVGDLADAAVPYVNKGVEAKCRDEVRKQIVGHLHEVACEAKAAGLTPGEVKEIVEASLKTDSGLYADIPAGLLGLGKGKR